MSAENYEKLHYISALLVYSRKNYGNMDSTLNDYYQSLLSQTPNRFSRYMYSELPWGERMFGLVGPRGIGKTILLLQYIKRNAQDKKMFYVSADNAYFTDNSLTGLADEFSKEGGEYLFIDEIHKYPNWSNELKQIYDTHPDLKVAFTGSSILDIFKGKADISRRAVMYQMQGLSFREFLELFKGINVPAYSLKQILENKAALTGVLHPLPLFKEYLHNGYYPFGADSLYLEKLNQVIGQTLETDIPQFANYSASTGRKLKMLLSVIARSVPFKPVFQKLADVVGVSRNNVADYLIYIEQAELVAQLRDKTGGIRGIGKVEKLYLDNTNLAYALEKDNSNIGNIRETFFFNQMRVKNEVISSKVSDFEINGITFEIGGKEKGAKQISSVSNGFIVKDDIEYGSGNTIPLWAFGLNY